jgi:RNA polymerase sigma-70 factor (ECF subfamily)
MTDDEFRGLFRDNYPLVLAYGLRRVDADTARDVAAETFLVAWRRLDAAPEQPHAWLLAVARRVLANELRRQGRANGLREKLRHEVVRAEQARDDHDSDTIDVVHEAMSTLSMRDRELLVLIGWEQLDQRAAAEVLGCSVAAVKVRLHRARRRLETALQSATKAQAAASAVPQADHAAARQHAVNSANPLKGSTS